MGNRSSTSSGGGGLKSMPASHLAAATNGNLVKIVGSQVFRNVGPWRDAFGKKDFAIKFRETCECIVGYIDMTSSRQRAPRNMILSDILKHGFYVSKPSRPFKHKWEKIDGVLQVVEEEEDYEEEEEDAMGEEDEDGDLFGDEDENNEEDDDEDDEGEEEVVEEDNDEDIGDLVKAEELLEDLEEDDGDDGGEILPEFGVNTQLEEEEARLQQEEHMYGYYPGNPCYNGIYLDAEINQDPNSMFEKQDYEYTNKAEYIEDFHQDQTNNDFEDRRSCFNYDGGGDDNFHHADVYTDGYNDSYYDHNDDAFREYEQEEQRRAFEEHLQNLDEEYNRYDDYEN